MQLEITPSRLAGSVTIPGSKSHTIRALAAGLLADGTSVIRAPLVSQDTLAVAQAVCRLGATIRRNDGDTLWKITGTGGKLTIPPAPLDMQNSGTGLRILTAVAALAKQNVSLDGDASLRSRPMAGLLEPLQILGASAVSTGGKAPLTVKGPLTGGHSCVPGTTSQFLTALLMALPLAENDSTLELSSLCEESYVHVTLDWLKRCGITVQADFSALRFVIPGEQHYSPFERTIPADFSTAAFPLAAGLLAGSKSILISHLDFSDAQGDKKIFDFLIQAGAKIGKTAEGAEIFPSSLQPMTLDLNDTPDALPILAVCAAFAPGESRLFNVAQARKKECDRIHAMAEMLSRMGADVRELPDALVIHGGKPLHGAELSGFNDHRIVMALAVAALRAEGKTTISGAEAAGVTWPGFIEAFRAMGAGFHEKEEEK